MLFPGLKHSLALAAVCLTAACATTPNSASGPLPDTELERALATLAHPDAPVHVHAGSKNVPAMLDGALLNGLTQSDITTVLGGPNRVRIDPPAHVWQYDLSHCFVDVFLYDDGNGPRVVYVQERPRQVKKLTAGLCLNKVWEDQRQRRANSLP